MKNNSSVVLTYSVNMSMLKWESIQRIEVNNSRSRVKEAKCNDRKAGSCRRIS